MDDAARAVVEVGLPDQRRGCQGGVDKAVVLLEVVVRDVDATAAGAVPAAVVIGVLAGIRRVGGVVGEPHPIQLGPRYVGTGDVDWFPVGRGDLLPHD